MTVLLLIALLGSVVFEPLSVQAAAPPPVTAAASTAAAAPSLLEAADLVLSRNAAPVQVTPATVPAPAAFAGDTGPDAVVPMVREQRGEVVARGLYSRTEANGDGTYVAVFSPRPMHWLDSGSGEWKAYDNALVASSSSMYALENKAAGYKLRLGRAADVALGRPVV